MARLGGTGASASTFSSLALRVSSTVALLFPHLSPHILRASVPHLAYLAYLWSYMADDSRSKRADIMEVREVLVPLSPLSDQNQQIQKEVRVRRVGQTSFTTDISPLQPNVPSVIAGGRVANRRINLLNLLINTILVVLNFDHLWAPRFSAEPADFIYSRVSSLTSQSASISFGLPSLSPSQPAGGHGQILYRPLVLAAQQGTEDVMPWSYSHAFVPSFAPYRQGEVLLDNLSAGSMYEYRFSPSNDESEDKKLSALNFTTFPHRETGSGASFRFLHTGDVKTYPRPYKLFDATKALWLALQTRSWRQYRRDLRRRYFFQPAWSDLHSWLSDLQERKAWSHVQFALLGLLSDECLPQKAHRQLDLASSDVRAALATIPMLPSQLRSPSEGSVIEPGALVTPESNFNYGDVAFFRMRPPFVERGEAESQDWRLGVDELAQWVERVNHTAVFKFILTPETLTPFFGGSKLEVEWRDSILEVLTFVPNVIVLAQCSHGFSVSTLRGTVVEFASPPFDPPPAGLLHTIHVPDLAKSHVETRDLWTIDGEDIGETVEFEATDRLMNYIPATPGAKWTSFEVNTIGRSPRIKAVAYDRGHPVWGLEYVGTRRTGFSKAIGSVAGTFQTLLRKFGFVARRWY